MKAIVINRTPDTAVTVPPSIAIVPSSAIVPDSKPLFLPGFSDMWSATPALAFKLSRLGKSIGQKFASRYYDSVVPAMLIRPVSLAGHPALEALRYAFDGALVTGKPNPLSGDGNYTMSCGDMTISLSDCHNDIDKVISTLSDYMTMQMGDLLIGSIANLSVAIAPGDNIQLSLNENIQGLDLRIK